MKKVLSALLAVIMAGAMYTPVLAENEISVILDGQKIAFPDAQPFIDVRERTLVPVRFVSEAMGANVGWDGESKTVEIVKDKDVVKYTIGQPIGYLNGEMMTFDSFGILKEDRTFVPLRFISELLSCGVDWSDDTKTVSITSPQEAIKFPEPKLTVHYPQSEYDKRLFWITIDNYRDFERNCPYYEFKLEFLNPAEFNEFEQDEGAINGWQKYSRNRFVSITNSDKTIMSVSRMFYSTRANMKTFKPKDGDTVDFKLTVHRKCSNETREYTYSEILKMPYSLINAEE